VLPRLAGFDPAALAAVASPDMRLEDGAGARLDSALAGIRIFRRHELDQAIVAAARAAGARIDARRVEALAPCGWPRHGAEPCGVRVTAGGEARRYEWAIGADGARGLSRRTAGLRPQGESVGLGATLRGLTAAQRESVDAITAEITRAIAGVAERGLSVDDSQPSVEALVRLFRL